MDLVLTTVIAICAFAIGALIVWIARNAQLQPLIAKLAAADQELSGLRSARNDADAARAAQVDAEKRLASAEARLEQSGVLDAQLEAQRRRVTELEAEKAALSTARDKDAAAHAEQVRQLAEMRREVQDQFKLLAGDVLKTSSEEFAKRAEELFKSQKELTAAEIDKRTAVMAELVKPIGDSLKAYDVALKEIEKARTEAYGELKATLGDVRTGSNDVKTITAGLVNALRASPKTRGRWGEETLRRVMELSGMVEHCDFETEKHFASDDESLRPDALISVAGGRSIVVDAKAPISAYLDAIASVNEEQRETLLKQHAVQLRERLRNLSSKSYWEKIAGSTDCVVMFVPGDNFVSAAFERDPDLFEDGIKNRVLICTPTTFIALAKAISYGWRQEKLAANALDVSRLGKELYARLATLGDHVSDLGRHINNAAKKFNAVVGSLESNVMPQARRFNELGVEGTAKPLGELSEVDTVVRFPQPNRDLLITKSGE